MEIIMPAAGLSARFPNMRPKYILSDFKGRMMFERSLESFIGKHNITIGILKEHNDTYNTSEYIKREYGDSIQVVVLTARTTGPADTVYQILKQTGLTTEEFLIKDCDSFFDHEHQEGNYICVSSVKDHEILKRLASKSFIVSNDQGIITSIIEKQVVSDKFCVGGYKFESADLFISTFDKLQNSHVKEIFVSHVIEECLNSGVVFKESTVHNYVDVGTAEDWFEYNDKAVIFCDIDGTIIKAQSRTEIGSKPVALEQNILAIKKLIATGSEVVFTTARPAQHHAITEKMLTALGFVNFKLLSGLSNAKRILINDYNEANPYPRAVSINIKRDHDNLQDFL
jgi:hydroxymethylpyrimidine pyrophosphatase-like HAD family hydrolase